jgi:hypothetical protein
VVAGGCSNKPRGMSRFRLKLKVQCGPNRGYGKLARRLKPDPVNQISTESLPAWHGELGCSSPEETAETSPALSKLGVAEPDDSVCRFFHPATILTLATPLALSSRPELRRSAVEGPAVRPSASQILPPKGSRMSHLLAIEPSLISDSRLLHSLAHKINAARLTNSVIWTALTLSVPSGLS